MNEQSLIFEKYLRVVNEGGAAGHMMHPFDLPKVVNLIDLVRTFQDADEKLEEGQSTIKLDGVNLSLKVIGEGNEKQFALDRGSQKEIDVKGITINDLSTRFPVNPQTGEVHGMVRKGGTILKIMNESIPLIKEELKDLDLWDNPSKFINTEYIEGTENVIDYGENKIIAFHGINQFFEKTDRKGNVTRPSELKPNVFKDEKGKLRKEKTVSRTVDYDHKALDSLREKVKPIAQKYGFDVETGIYATKKGEPNFDNVLNQDFSINLGDNVLKMKLRDYINSYNHIPKVNRITNKQGKSIGAVSKENYINILNSDKVPLNQIYDEQDYDTAISGALTYHLTKELGNELLKNYTTDNYGDADKHEGIVISHIDYGKDGLGNPNSIKITGEFILSGMGGALASNRSIKTDEDDQSAPAANMGNGHMDFSSYFTSPRSSKDPGGTGFKGKIVK